MRRPILRANNYSVKNDYDTVLSENKFILNATGLRKPTKDFFSKKST